MKLSGRRDMHRADPLSCAAPRFLPGCERLDLRGYVRPHATHRRRCPIHTATEATISHILPSHAPSR